MMQPEGSTYREEKTQSHGVKGNLGRIWVLSFLSWPFSFYSGLLSTFPFTLFSSASHGPMAMMYSGFRHVGPLGKLLFLTFLPIFCLLFKTQSRSFPFRTSLLYSAALLIFLRI